MQMFVKLERSRESADDPGLYVTVGSDKPYKKALWFQSVAERGMPPFPFPFHLPYLFLPMHLQCLSQRGPLLVTTFSLPLYSRFVCHFSVPACACGLTETFCDLVHVTMKHGEAACRIFSEIDTNGDGVLDLSDLGRLCTQTEEIHTYSRAVTPAAGIDFARFLVAYSQVKQQSKELQLELVAYAIEKERGTSISTLIGRLDSTSGGFDGQAERYIDPDVLAAVAAVIQAYTHPKTPLPKSQAFLKLSGTAWGRVFSGG